MNECIQQGDKMKSHYYGADGWKLPADERDLETRARAIFAAACARWGAAFDHHLGCILRL